MVKRNLRESRFISPPAPTRTGAKNARGKAATGATDTDDAEPQGYLEVKAGASAESRSPYESAYRRYEDNLAASSAVIKTQKIPEEWKPKSKDEHDDSAMVLIFLFSLLAILVIILIMCFIGGIPLLLLATYQIESLIQLRESDNINCTTSR